MLTTLKARYSGHSTVIPVPKEVREVVGLAAGDFLDVEYSEGKMSLKTHTPSIRRIELPFNTESLLVGATSCIDDLPDMDLLPNG